MFKEIELAVVMCSEGHAGPEVSSESIFDDKDMFTLQHLHF